MVWCDDHCSQAVQWDVWTSGVSASIRSEEVCISAGGLKAPELAPGGSHFRDQVLGGWWWSGVMTTAPRLCSGMCGRRESVPASGQKRCASLLGDSKHLSWPLVGAAPETRCWEGGGGLV